MPKSGPCTSIGASALIPLAAGAALLLGACAPVVYVTEPAPAYAQAGPSPAYYPETPAPAQPAVADPLDQLMAPIALYPDPLISLILPAAAFPSDIAAAGSYLNGGGDPGQADTQPWDPSVRALAHYPDVVKWMAGNAQWTQTVGAEYVSQPAAVMGAIQRLRELARAAGTLTDSPQQQVIVQGSYVEIEPAQPDVIYVPSYDPAVVFVDQPYYGYNGPFFTWGPAYGAGPWLTYGCDWGGGGIIIVGADYWHGSGGWWHPAFEGRGEYGAYASANVRPWSFPANRERPQVSSGWQNRSQVLRPQLAAGAPAHPPQSAYRDIHTRGPAAVEAVARNPAAFQGKPINRAIISKSNGSSAGRAASPERPAEERPRAPAAAPERQAPGSSGRIEGNQEAKPEQARAAAPSERVEKSPAGHESKPAKAPAPKEEKAKKKAKPAPKGDKDKDKN
jgi:hypothetical protein